MALEPNEDGGLKEFAAGDACRAALLERIRASAAFSRSPRLRQLLDYLCEKSLADPDHPLTEERIGVDVFGRPQGYDTGSDTIVRVQVSQLRKRLEHYFLAEGAAEPVVIELPKRSYTPVCRLRDQVPAEKGAAEPDGAPSKWKFAALSLAVLLAFCIALAGYLAFQNGRLRDRITMGQGRTPFRDHFWLRLFPADRPAQVVASDGTAMILCDFLGRTLTPSEYIASGYPEALIDAEIHDPATRKAVKDAMENNLTNMADLHVASRLTRVAGALGGRLDLVLARDFRYQPQSPENLIFLSHRKANPWVGLFEERMNFRYDFDAKEYRASIVNRAPMAGEQARYPVQWGAHTFALIAFLRKPIGGGNVLLLEGGDVGAVEASCDLLTDESRIRSVYDRLGIRPQGAIPEFEILLSAKQLRGSVHDYTIIAHRVLR